MLFVQVNLVTWHASTEWLQITNSNGNGWYIRNRTSLGSLSLHNLLLLRTNRPVKYLALTFYILVSSAVKPTDKPNGGGELWTIFGVISLKSIPTIVTQTYISYLLRVSGQSGPETGHSHREPAPADPPPAAADGPLAFGHLPLHDALSLWDPVGEDGDKGKYLESKRLQLAFQLQWCTSSVCFHWLNLFFFLRHGETESMVRTNV